MINKFSQFLIEEEKTVYFTFGRMNPPTIGHGKLLDKLSSSSGKNDYKVFVSQSQDPKKNPLMYAEKIKHIRKMFPKHARSIIMNKNVKTAIDCAVALYDQGYRKIVMVVGSDRINEFDALLNKYNGKDARHGFYNFESIKIISAGERDPDAEGVEGMSASKQRENAQNNDFVTFSQGLPKSMSNKDAKALFNAVRSGMGLKEAREFKNHIQLEPVSDLREAYIRDNIFEKGEEVVITDKGIVGKIKHLGTNYLIVESKGETWRCWLNAVSKVDPNQKIYWDNAPYKDPGDDGILREAFTKRQKQTKLGVAFEENQPEWGTPESTAKAKKVTPGQNEGLWDNIRARRAAGKPKLKPGDKNYPKTLKIESERKKESPQDPDISDLPGTQPKAYHAGLSKAQKLARDRQFKKQSKMSDNDPKAYKPAPGDKTTKTKQSKHTLKYRQMFGEEAPSFIDIAKQRIEREKEADKRKHDRLMDRARTRDTQFKNKETK
jgi:hypothetical protein